MSTIVSRETRANIIFETQKYINENQRFPALKEIAAKVDRQCPTVSVVLSVARENGELNMRPINKLIPSAREHQVLCYIDKIISERRIAPSQMEIAEEVMHSTQTVWHDINSLTEKGYLDRIPGRQRAIWVTQKGIDYIKEKENQQCQKEQ